MLYQKQKLSSVFNSTQLVLFLFVQRGRVERVFIAIFSLESTIKGERKESIRALFFYVFQNKIYYLQGSKQANILKLV